MERHHLHMPAWMHLHKPDWYTLGVRFDHLIHDPRFWAVVAITVLVGLMIVTAFIADPRSPGALPDTPIYPIYPYMYMP